MLVVTELMTALILTYFVSRGVLLLTGMMAPRMQLMARHGVALLVLVGIVYALHHGSGGPDTRRLLWVLLAQIWWWLIDSLRQLRHKSASALPGNQLGGERRA